MGTRQSAMDTRKGSLVEYLYRLYGTAMKRMLLVLFFTSFLLNTFLTRLRMRSCKYRFILAGWSRFNLVKMLSVTCLWYRNVKRITVEGKLVLWPCSNGTFGRAEVTSWQSVYKINSTIHKRRHDHVVVWHGLQTLFASYYFDFVFLSQTNPPSPAASSKIRLAVTPVYCGHISLLVGSEGALIMPPLFPLSARQDNQIKL